MEIITKKKIFNEIRKCQKNQKMQNLKKQNSSKYKKNVFDQNFDENYFLE